MPAILFTTSGIEALLSDIDSNKAQGPDKIASDTVNLTSGRYVTAFMETVPNRTLEVTR